MDDISIKKRKNWNNIYSNLFEHSWIVDQKLLLLYEVEAVDYDDNYVLYFFA